ncbi:MAG TPA: hypothetical protein VMX15_00720 [Candidatus Heimdallarchaeota archaeon]|nr:hypothetical protein [Candidatus Heimdallarchaeota archaeon]
MIRPRTLYTKFLCSPQWRLRWLRGDFPRRYDPDHQPRIDAEFYRMALSSEGIPGGSMPVVEEDADA